MGKKSRTRNEERSLANKEAYTRMNFLYQAAHVVLAQNPENSELSRFYASTMKSVGMKLLCKLDPSIKRTICKYCHSVLIPGVTSKVRVKAHRETHIVVKCLDCGTLKRFNARKNHKLWCDQQETRGQGTMEENKNVKPTLSVSGDHHVTTQHGGNKMKTDHLALNQENCNLGYGQL